MGWAREVTKRRSRSGKVSSDGLEDDRQQSSIREGIGLFSELCSPN